MDAQVNRLVDKVWAKYLQMPPNRRLMIAIGGMPGSGKTTLARAVAAGLNRKHADALAGAAGAAGDRATGSAAAAAAPAPAQEPVALAVPMDGFHLTRAQLSALPDPVRAHARRGAEFTFDGQAFLTLVERLRAPLPDAATSMTTTTTTTTTTDGSSSSVATILCPSFDHAVKDPVPDAIAIGPHQRILLFEGNYVCLDRAPWRTAADPEHMDERWFVEVDAAVARARLVRRHVAAGIAADAADAGARADANDLVNGAEIVAGRVADIDETVVSREDAAWA
ncbi:kinase-related protein [Niveomyces insectorum RCEF 264]|uniref:Kinase-related protein n=1 Tax=Niveomyces insectorum RCEF 264 TaxID=1081102 RepID=A0A167YRF8_9HYPO|nr:kinase-related protein [Niveomyces insectorum RCEF 264]